MINFLISQGAELFGNAVCSNDSAKKVVKSLTEGSMKLVFHYLTSFVKEKHDDMVFWGEILKFAGSVGGIVITTFVTVVGNFFTITVDSLVIPEIEKMIDVIVNMVQGSVAEASYEIRTKAEELEKQAEKLEEFTVAVKKLLPK